MWLWLTFHLSLLHPSIPRFSPLCQHVSSVSRHGVRPSHKPAFPPAKHSPLRPLITTIRGFQAETFWHRHTGTIEPIMCSLKVTMTQHLCSMLLRIETFHFDILAVTSQVLRYETSTTNSLVLGLATYSMQCRVSYGNVLSYLRSVKIIQGCCSAFFLSVLRHHKTFHGVI